MRHVLEQTKKCFPKRRQSLIHRELNEFCRAHISLFLSMPASTKEVTAALLNAPAGICIQHALNRHPIPLCSLDR